MNTTATTDQKLAMIAACKVGDAGTVAALLKTDPGLCHAENPAGRFAALHYAVRAGRAAVVRLLLEAGADPNPFEHMMRNHCGVSTLELARARGFREVVELLEEAIAARHQSRAAATPFQLALKESRLEEILRLVKQCPDWVNSTDDEGNTPLHKVAEQRPVNLEWLSELVALGADTAKANFLGFTPLHLTLFRNHAYTSRREDWRAAGFFLGKGAGSNICLECAAGNLENVRRILDRDPDQVNFQDTNLKRPLSCAAEFGHWEVVSLLLERGADPNAPEASPFTTFPLVCAVQQNQLEMVRLLLQRGANPLAGVDASGNALYIAVEKGYTDIADELALAGASIEAASYAWRCDLPVLAALLKANPSLAPELLSYNDESRPEKSAMVIKMAFRNGADPAQVGAWTLYRACNTPALLRVFFEHGVDPNTADAEGKTTLHGMNRFPGCDGAAVLLEYGANIHARDDVHLGTPLAWAALFNNLDMARLLLARGAKTNLPDDQPWATPLFWARYKGHEEMEALLLEHGATA